MQQKYTMKTLLFLFVLVFLSFSAGAQKIVRVEPLSWWVRMHTPLTLMFYGENLRDCSVEVDQQGMSVRKVRNAESPNYLFVDMDIAPDARAGEYTLLLRKGKKKLTYTYKLEGRREKSAGREGFSSADMIYLLMPDRFANGDPKNDATYDTAEKPDRNDYFGRHGGDLQGMIDRLDYIASVGATAVWSTPLLFDNEPKSSYHGYACADYYRIDPRFGDNALYRTFVTACHRRGLKVIMDVVTNHCGAAHWWMRDLPYQNWVHQFDRYTSSNHLSSVNMDSNASTRDRMVHESGWFDTSMPDMNLNHPDLLQYFKQWAVWWMEYADLDGLRVDTYFYNEKESMAEWCKAVRAEYPAVNIVGECWTTSPAQLAYWEAGTKNKDGFCSYLPSVMDFPLQSVLCKALTDDDTSWDSGMKLIYRSLSHDFLFDDPCRLLIMAANHDTERVADEVGKNPEKAKLVATLLATLRGVPQIFSGDELMFASKDLTQGHGGLRVDFPGGWPGDTLNLFDASQRSTVQQDVFDHYSRLFNWRKTESVIHHGRTMHFAVEDDNMYAYFRYDDNGAVFVCVNAASQPCTINWERYDEVLRNYKPEGKDVLSGRSVTVRHPLYIAPLSSLIVKFER